VTLLGCAPSLGKGEMNLRTDQIQRLTQMAFVFARWTLENLPEGTASHIRPEEIVSSAFLDFSRRWEPDKCSPEALLMLLVKSRIAAMHTVHHTRFADNVVRLRPLSPRPIGSRAG
jgi:hypothetical protein